MEKGSDIGFKSRCVAGRKVVAKWCIILGTWNGQLLAGNIGRAGFGISDDRTAMYIYIYTYRFGQESASLGNIEKVLTVLH